MPVFLAPFSQNIRQEPDGKVSFAMGRFILFFILLVAMLWYSNSQLAYFY